MHTNTFTESNIFWLYVDKFYSTTTIVTVIVLGVEWNNSTLLLVLLMSWCSIMTRNLNHCITADQGIYFLDFILGMI